MGGKKRDCLYSQKTEGHAEDRRHLRWVTDLSAAARVLKPLEESTARPWGPGVGTSVTRENWKITSYKDGKSKAEREHEQ